MKKKKKKKKEKRKMESAESSGELVEMVRPRVIHCHNFGDLLGRAVKKSNILVFTYTGVSIAVGEYFSR